MGSVREASYGSSVDLAEAPSITPPEPPAAGVADREEWIDFMLEGTFPASDPPAWTGLREAEERRKKG